MKIMHSIVSLVFGIAILYHPCSYAEVRGSDTAVSIITNSPIFPAADIDNTMLGFGYFQGGFTLQDATTSCTFDCVFPVSGIIDMKGGELYLLKDLVLAEPLDLAGLGKIIGNNHTINFCESVTSLPSNFSLIKDVNLVFKHDVELNSTVSIQGNCYIQCAGTTITFNNNASLVIDSNANLEIQDALLQNIGNTTQNASISCADNTGQLHLNNTTVALANDWTFTSGSIHFKNSSTIIGAYNLYYTSNLSSVIEEFSTLSLDEGVKFNFGKSSLSSPEPLILAEKSSTLECKDCTLHITASGAQLTHGKLNFDGSVILEIDSTETINGLSFGDHITADNDLEINCGPDCHVTLQQGSLTYNNINSNGFIKSASSSNLTLNSNTIFHLASSCTLPNNNFVLNYNGTSLPTLLFNPDTELYLANTHFYIPGIEETIYNGSFQYPYSSALFFLDTNNSIFLTNGSLVVPTKIFGSSNKISGNGSINSQLTMNNNSSSATLALQGSIDAAISLNGGTLKLLADTVFTASNSFLTTGTINLGNRMLTLQSAIASEQSVPIFWIGTSGDIEIMQDTTLTSTWTFIGNVILDANGNAINFAGGSFAVAPDSNLTIKNARLNDIVQDSIHCADNTGNITLYNVTWAQANNFVFEQGALNYKGTVLMAGPNLQFTYATTMTGKFNNDTTLILDNLFTFSYAPSNNSTTLLEFTDFSSKFALNHSVLYITPGLQLTKGQITLQQGPTIYAFGEGLTLGDMTISDSSADMQVTFLDNTNTTLIGTLKYQNNLLTSWQMWTSAILTFTWQTPLYLYRTISINMGALNFAYYGDGSTNVYRYETPCPIESYIIGTAYGDWQYQNMCN